MWENRAGRRTILSAVVVVVLMLLGGAIRAEDGEEEDYDASKVDVDAEHEVCTTEGDLCLPLASCPFFTREDFLRRGKEARPPLCGFNGSEPVVCCTTDPTSVFAHAYNRHTLSGQMCSKYESTICSKEKSQSNQGGRSVVSRHLQYMVRLGYGTGKEVTWNCSGTVISPRYVLSSASCSKYPTLGPPTWAKLGNGSSSRTYKISLRFLHPDYSHPVVDADIALYRLDREVAFDRGVRPVCLHQYTMILTHNSVLAPRWKRAKAGNATLLLEAVELDLLPVKTCADSFKAVLPPSGYDTRSMICAGVKKGKKPACPEDGRGGPTVLELNRLQEAAGCSLRRQVGVATTGTKCGPDDAAAIYTNVAHYLPWIESIVWPENSTSSLNVWQ